MSVASYDDTIYSLPSMTLWPCSTAFQTLYTKLLSTEIYRTCRQRHGS